MNIRRITPHVHYVGINDRNTWKFENLWPLPYGVSYNSYLVEGTEKTALIDTVELGYLHSFEAKINEVLEGKGIDYLIVNHMEPDHSGGYP